MRPFVERRFRRSNLVWLGGVAAGLLLGGAVAYGVVAVSGALGQH